MVLDFFYKQICLGKTNAEILLKLQSTDLPMVTEERVNLFRKEFREKEVKFPDKMKLFRQRLGIKQTIIT